MLYQIINKMVNNFNIQIMPLDNLIGKKFLATSIVHEMR
jgi:hypothetical protein